MVLLLTVVVGCTDHSPKLDIDEEGIEQLSYWLQRDKMFEENQPTGYGGMSGSKQEEATNLMHGLIARIINVLKNEPTEKELANVFKEGLEMFDRESFDDSDREMLVEYYTYILDMNGLGYDILRKYHIGNY